MTDSREIHDSNYSGHPYLIQLVLTADLPPEEGAGKEYLMLHMTPENAADLRSTIDSAIQYSEKRKNKNTNEI